MAGTPPRRPTSDNHDTQSIPTSAGAHAPQPLSRPDASVEGSPKKNLRAAVTAASNLSPEDFERAATEQRLQRIQNAVKEVGQRSEATKSELSRQREEQWKGETEKDRIDSEKLINIMSQLANIHTQVGSGTKQEGLMKTLMGRMGLLKGQNAASVDAIAHKQDEKADPQQEDDRKEAKYVEFWTAPPEKCHE